MTDGSNLSPGCQLCQEGKWLCIFLTYRCEAGCPFCPAPEKRDHIRSAVGNDRDTILEFCEKHPFDGISFSGGDPFLVYGRMMEWMSEFKSRFPDVYYWVYTPGTDVDRQRLTQLAKAGLDEIRFNIAASNYDLPFVWSMIKTARDCFPRVSVEIPVIPSQLDRILRAMERMEQIGIDYLNLHDLILNGAMTRKRGSGYRSFVLNRTMPVKYSEKSHRAAQMIRRKAAEENYSFSVHHCSMVLKEEQMKQRRIAMSRIWSDAVYDRVNPDGTFNRYFEFPPDMELTRIESRLGKVPEDSEFLCHAIPLAEVASRKRVARGRLIEANYVPKMEWNLAPVLIDWNWLDGNDTENTKCVSEK